MFSSPESQAPLSMICREAKAAAVSEWHKVHEEAIALKARAARRTMLGQQVAELEGQNERLKKDMRSAADSKQPLEAKKKELLR